MGTRGLTRSAANTGTTIRKFGRGGREYGLFLPGEKARVLNISAIGISRAAALNSFAKTTDPKSPNAAWLMDEIHNFT